MRIPPRWSWGDWPKWSGMGGFGKSGRNLGMLRRGSWEGVGEWMGGVGGWIWW